MNVWVYRRGEWEPAAAPRTHTPGALGFTAAGQSLTPDDSVALYVGGESAEFPYAVGMRFGAGETRRYEWVCMPDLPSLLAFVQLIGPLLRSDMAVQSYVNTILEERLGPPPDRPAGTGSARDLTAMNTVLFNDASISADLERVAHVVEDDAPSARRLLEEIVADLGRVRAQITTEGDPNGIRFDAVITLLQSASLLLQSDERESATAEVKKALAAWKLDGSEPLLP